MHVVIAKVDEVFFDGEASSLTAPGAEGELTVLPRHEPLITTLKEGIVTVRPTSDISHPLEFPIAGGLLEVRHEGATVIL